MIPAKIELKTERETNMFSLTDLTLEYEWIVEDYVLAEEAVIDLSQYSVNDNSELLCKVKVSDPQGAIAEGQLATNFVNLPPFLTLQLEQAVTTLFQSVSPPFDLGNK